MRLTIAATALAAALAALPGTDATALDAACSPGKAGADLSGDEAKEVYDCIAAGLDEGWQKGGKRWIPADRMADYRGWELASTFPAAPGLSWRALPGDPCE